MSTSKIFLFLLALAIIGGAFWYGYENIGPKSGMHSFLPENNGEAASDNSIPPLSVIVDAPKKIPSLLDGMPSPFSSPEEERAAMVMIDNIITARPYQKNIEKASIVFEALAEGGITRYLALFSSATLLYIEEIGPVRSARDYFVDFAKPFGGAYVHAGGSDQAMLDLSDIKTFLNLDNGHAGVGKSDPFYRVETIPAPHNLFIKSSTLLERLSETNKITPVFHFLSENTLPPEGTGDPSEKISLSPSTRDNSSLWEWDNEQKVFLRSQEKTPFLFAAKNLLVLEIPSFLIENDPKNRISLESTGTGVLWIFQNGTVQKGTWARKTRDDAFTFLQNGKEVLLIPGQTWISVVPSEKSIALTPAYPGAVLESQVPPL